MLMAAFAAGLVLFMVADTIGLVSKDSAVSSPVSSPVSTTTVSTTAVSTTTVVFPVATIVVEPEQPDDFIVEPAIKKCPQLRVMPFGDSLTSLPESYRGPLFRALFTQNVNVDFVGSVKTKPAGGGDPNHEGHSGFTIGPGVSANLLDNVGRWIVEAKPDVIILTIGTNDLAGNSDLQSAAPGKYRALVEKIQNIAPNVVIVLNDLPPTTTYKRGFAPQVALDAAAKALGTARTDDLLLYAATRDEFDRLGYDPKVDIQNDRIHLTVEGGKKFALALLPTVRDAIVLSKTKRSC